MEGSGVPEAFELGDELTAGDSSHGRIPAA